ncbi:GlxA family transcriptional regulator [Kitasatospora sp. MBT63]|uniref:GlxA family transcriptional regulator n=1 Tax=Kitasatospora sp. MBT63 TaxID=1444768 RepID=UPI000539FAE8|nr:GlxA family transcriptional regulator [Kitasatospora sp. MBT63]
MSTCDVLIVLFDEVQSLDVTGPLEVLSSARSRGAVPGRNAYRIRTASPGGGPVRCSSGLTLVPDEDLDLAATPHTLLVPGGRGTRGPADPALVARIAELAAGAERVVSVCTGAFLLAEAGLLDGHRATTHWAYCETFARRFPAVRLDPEPIFVRDGRISTSAGVTAGIDLALALVEEDLGRSAALAIARHLVMYLRRPGGQAQFSTHLAGQLAERHPLREVQRWIGENPSADLSVTALAERATLSPRQFARAFAAEVGVPPGRYVDGIRLETARRLLEETGQGVEEIGRTAGYGSTEAMRRAFVRGLGIPPSEYRRRFRPPSPLPAAAVG